MLERLVVRRPRTVSAGLVVAVIFIASLNAMPAKAAVSENLFGNAIPTVTSAPDFAKVELGVQLKAAVNGQITGIRFYKGPKDTGTHTGSLWSGSTRMATVTFSSETASGWQQMIFPQPVSITAGQVYTASYLAPNGGYAVNNPYVFPKASGNLTAIKGVYAYNGGYPDAVYQTSNYWVDVLFTPTVVTPPTTTATSSTPVTTSSVGTSPSPTPTTGPTTTTTTTTSTATTTPPPATLNLPRVPWEGGPAYWAQFPKASAAGWTDPSFFPIAVFTGKPSQAAALKAVGVNTYMGAEHDGSAMSTMTGQGMYVMPQLNEWTPAEVGSDPKAVGWFVSDECDIGIGCSGDNAIANLADQTSKVNAVKGLKDGRFTFANYSNGILNHYWAQGTMAGLMSVVDAASVDKYAYTSPFVDSQMIDSPDWPTGANPVTSGAYGWLVDQMRKYQAPAGAHPNWVFIESAMPLLNDANSLTITPAQIEGADWASIIHEARGIAYFQHNNGSVCGFYSLVDCDAGRLAQIAAINASIKSYAPILNTQSYQWTFNTTTNTMLKVKDGSAYIFADIGLNQTTGAKTFTMPAGITSTSVEVVGEGRSLPVVAGKFTDAFALESTHHIYKTTI